MNLQIEMLRYLEAIRTDFFTSIMVAVTMMAEKLFLVGIIAILYWCVDKTKSIRLAWMILFSDVINKSIKGIIRTPRPFEQGVVTPLRLKEASGYAFPSGHTQAATSFWIGSVLVLKSKAAVVVGGIMIVATAFSRLYLGVHWPLDVVGGVLFGVFSVFIADQLLGEEAAITRWHVIVVSLFVLFGLAVPVDADLAKSFAALWGLTWGIYLEQKYIHFKPLQKGPLQLLKIVIGFTGLAIIYIGFKNMFPVGKVFDMMRYALALVWMSAGAPYIFTRIKYGSK